MLVRSCSTKPPFLNLFRLGEPLTGDGSDTRYADNDCPELCVSMMYSAMSWAECCVLEESDAMSICSDNWRLADVNNLLLAAIGGEACIASSLSDSMMLSSSCFCATVMCLRLNSRQLGQDDFRVVLSVLIYLLDDTFSSLFCFELLGVEVISNDDEGF